MHALSHSLAHRGPGASRARTRWQPYSSSISSATPNRSPQQYLHTPASTVSSTPSTSYISPICHLDRTRNPAPTPVHPPLSQPAQFREAQKNKYVTRLVDQAVKSLCDIWQPEDIPQVFRTTSRTAFSAPITSDANPSLRETAPAPQIYTSRNTQLPSPISPSTHPSPISNSPIAPTSQGSIDHARSSSHLIPIRGFVHEVLRRSRTSTGVLQTALCYLEAVRVKVPELLRKENSKASPDYNADEDADSRIIMGTAAEIEESRMAGEDGDQAAAWFDLSKDLDVVMTEVFKANDSSMQPPPTAPLTDNFPSMDCGVPCISAPKKASPPLPPLAPTPSPLLCPRRTFLACLILASKFMQDRSYSNRAWAKLAGLPPREIGRCERAVGEALQWRLWVGKGPAPSSVPAPTIGPHRGVARCRSEVMLQRATCAWPVPTAPAVLHSAHSAAGRSIPLSQSGLRRHSTMPDIGSSGSSMLATSVFSSVSTSSFEASTASFNAVHVGLPYAASAAQQAHSGDSPWLATPTLTYSPMSTGSTSSLEDGDRNISLPGLGAISEYRGTTSAKTTGSISGLRDAYRVMDRNVKLPAIEPMIVGASVQLPPISEAVYNPALVERFVDAPGRNDGLGNSDLFSSYSNWVESVRS
ncbi:hypothetical protein EW026_g2956 [Hermanssonia centrifuga]|uniref:Uncharacterized protein n=1 Tax=Hermanssonia centrifuga TaxID=98765 RepID=A0A4S4KMP1_9APHY|nr:hypothetical protein EW026_g2956 [Hermanssonia centrifuga]